MKTLGEPCVVVEQRPLAGRENQASLRVRTGRGEDALALLDDEWDRLVERQRIPNPMLSASWLRALVEQEPGMPFVVSVNGADGPVAAGAFGLRGVGRHGGPKIATWLGEGSLRITPDLLVGPQAAEGGAALIDAVLGEAQVLYLGQAPLDGGAARILAERRHLVRELPSDPSWIVPLTPNHLEPLRKRAEFERRRAVRHGAHVSVRVAADPLEVAAALERLFSLYHARWRERNQPPPSRFAASDDQCAWYRRAVGAMAAHDRVRLAEVFEDGALVASLLGFVTGQGALFHTTATRVGGQLHSPGKLAMLSVADSVRAAGAVMADLGRGSSAPEGPKGKLDPVSRPFARFVVSASWPAHVAFGGILQMRDGMRHLARQRA